MCCQGSSLKFGCPVDSLPLSFRLAAVCGERAASARIAAEDVAGKTVVGPALDRGAERLYQSATVCRRGQSIARSGTGSVDRVRRTGVEARCKGRGPSLYVAIRVTRCPEESLEAAWRRRADRCYSFEAAGRRMPEKMKSCSGAGVSCSRAVPGHEVAVLVPRLAESVQTVEAVYYLLARIRSPIRS